MAFSYDVSTDAGKVRLYCIDSNATNYIFEDDEIAAFLSMADNNIKKAASDALLVIASNEAYVGKRIEILNLKLDGPAVATELRRIAKALKDDAMDDLGFDIAQAPVDNPSYEELYVKGIIRELT